MKIYLTLEKFANFGPGIGFRSAFVKKAGSRSAYNACGSETLIADNQSVGTRYSYSKLI
jgi:hypothetical protein